MVSKVMKRLISCRGEVIRPCTCPAAGECTVTVFISVHYDDGVSDSDEDDNSEDCDGDVV